MLEDSKLWPGENLMKIVCPNCKKEIEKQAEIQIPGHSEDSFDLSLGKPSVTYGTLVLKDGKHFLVFEVVVKCPYCQESFCTDVWLSISDGLG